MNQPTRRYPKRDLRGQSVQNQRPSRSEQRQIAPIQNPPQTHQRPRQPQQPPQQGSRQGGRHQAARRQAVEPRRAGPAPQSNYVVVEDVEPQSRMFAYLTLFGCLGTALLVMGLIAGAVWWSLKGSEPSAENNTTTMTDMDMAETSMQDGSAVQPMAEPTAAADPAAIEASAETVLDRPNIMVPMTPGAETPIPQPTVASGAVPPPPVLPTQNDVSDVEMMSPGTDDGTEPLDTSIMGTGAVSETVSAEIMDTNAMTTTGVVSPTAPMSPTVPPSSPVGNPTGAGASDAPTIPPPPPAPATDESSVTPDANDMANSADSPPSELSSGAVDSAESIPINSTLSFTDPDAILTINAETTTHNISPLIYGVSGGPPEFIVQTGATFNSWGGNANSRYNWRLGNAWNSARDWYYRNGDYDYDGESASDDFYQVSADLGVKTRLTIPALGWVAKNRDMDTCSFPLPDGTCTDGKLAACDNPGQIADPNDTSVKSTPADIAEWMQHLKDQGFEIPFVAMGNEPELWGATHYDVHPDCTTYDEILDRYTAYATAIREVLPDAELTGPTTCCWYFYWNSAAGEADRLAHGGQDYLPWFLDQMRLHEETTGNRILDVFDIHYYPSGLFEVPNSTPAIAGHRLRASRSLWDKTYTDESAIGRPIFLIPRMKELIAKHYPGTKLGLSEWNFGADDTVNGGLAVADVLGVFGQEDLYFANYWTHPEIGTPGYFAFKLYGNYDDAGGRFGDQSVAAESNNALVTTYAARHSETGNLHLILINKRDDKDLATTINLQGFNAASEGQSYQYSGENLQNIVNNRIVTTGSDVHITLPAYSMTHLILEANDSP